MAFASPYHSALEAELNVLRRPKADLLYMRPGINWIIVAFQRAHQEFITKGTGEPGKQRNIQRLDAGDPERVDVFSIVGVRHSATQTRALPGVLFAERYYMVEILGGDVSLQESSLAGRRNRAVWNGGLLVVRHWDTRGPRCPAGGVVEISCAVNVGEFTGQRGRVAGS